MKLEHLKPLIKRGEKTKIVLMVMDGLGGIPFDDARPMTALEAAKSPNLDALAARGLCGLQEPVATGITPGSGPGHLGLFGYDPLDYQVGRGVLSALGIDFDLQKGDVAARGNFCTVEENGLVTDRRAGRIPSEKGAELCDLLQKQVSLEGVQVFIRPVKEYRFLLVLRGKDLASEVSETDPQELGVAPIKAHAEAAGAEQTAHLVQTFVEQSRGILHDRHPANMVLLRGFSQRPDWPTVGEAFGLKAVAIAMYPMYRGVAKLVGMDALPPRESVAGEFDQLAEHWAPYDFHFIHVKHTDSAGEDGNFDDKVAQIEEADTMVPRVLDLEPDVFVVTGDHSTPAAMRYHSWHPVPVVLWSRVCRPDQVTAFSERACLAGGLGPRFPSHNLMPLMLANAERLEKFGA